jgi:hypothetical protein
LEDLGDVAEVERVVRLGGRGSQVLRDLRVDVDGACVRCVTGGGKEICKKRRKRKNQGREGEKYIKKKNKQKRSNAHLTRLSQVLATSSENLFTRKNPPRIEEKIVNSTSSEAGGTHSMWKREENRPVISARPPPGGAAAEKTTTSLTCLRNTILNEK